MNRLAKILLAGVLVTTSTALADNNEEYRRSQSWESHKIIDRETQEDLGSAFLTHRDTLRIQELSSNTKGSLKLVTDRRTNLRKLKEECADTHGKLDSRRYSDMRTKLQIEVPVFRALNASRAFTQDARGGTHPLKEVENPMVITQASFNFALLERNYTERGYYSPNYIIDDLSSKLLDQGAKLVKDASVDVDISKYPKLVCDIVKNQIRIDADFVYTLEDAKHRTRRTLRTDEVEALDKALPRGQKLSHLSNKSALILSGALMAEAMGSSWRKTVGSFGPANFLKMHGQLFNPERKQWKSLQTEDHRRISHLFFKVLPYGPQTHLTNVGLTFNGEVDRD